MSVYKWAPVPSKQMVWIHFGTGDHKSEDYLVVSSHQCQDLRQKHWERGGKGERGKEKSCLPSSRRRLPSVKGTPPSTSFSSFVLISPPSKKKKRANSSVFFHSKEGFVVPAYPEILQTHILPHPVSISYHVGTSTMDQVPYPGIID